MGQAQSGGPCGAGFDRRVGGFVDALAGGFHARGGPAAPPPGGAVGGAGHWEGAPPPTRLPAAARLVALGDLHGDLGKTLRALRVAGVVDARGRWSGGETVVVQVGDQLDRGGDEIAILHLLERLQGEARAAGGAVHVLNGNHETINSDGRFRYASAEGMQEFQEWQKVQRLAQRLKEGCGCAAGLASPGAEPEPERAQEMKLHRMKPEFRAGGEARMSALQPGGPIARRFFASHPVVLQVGQSVFVHGGLLPQHVDYGLERINAESRQWLLGKGERYGPHFLQGRDAVVWSRRYSVEEEKCECDTLREALAKVPGASRMVVGHTVQQPEGINGACGGRVWRTDVGMSKGVADAAPEVLEILGDRTVRRLREGRPPQVLVP